VIVVVAHITGKGGTSAPQEITKIRVTDMELKTIYSGNLRIPSATNTVAVTLVIYPLYLSIVSKHMALSTIRSENSPKIEFYSIFMPNASISYSLY
jgi:hypothetical protein